MCASEVTDSLLDYCLESCQSCYGRFTPGDWCLCRQQLLAFFSTRRVRVSIFLQRDLQGQDGTLRLEHGGPLTNGALPLKKTHPLSLNYHDANGSQHAKRLGANMYAEPLPEAKEEVVEAKPIAAKEEEPPAAKPSPPARPPAPKPPPAAASADEDHEYGESTDHPGVKFTVPKQATLREAVVELAENEQLVYRLRDYRLRIVDQDYGKKDYHAILSRDAEQRLLGVIVWKDERSRRGIDVEIKILAVKGADTPNTVSQGTASDLISEMVGKLRNPSSQPVEASITGAINPRDKPMIGRWDQLGFIHSDETMSCARTIFTNC